MRFDYIIIGAGAAGLHLALSMERHGLGKKVLILDPDPKNRNDKTYCFWNKSASALQSIVKYNWANGRYFNNKKEVSISFDEYSYNLIQSKDFYQFAKTKLQDHPDFTWLPLQVDMVNEQENKVEVSCDEEVFEASHVFDSRIHNDFYTSNEHITLLQHFKGWVIETENPIFETDSFTMMDFRLQFEDSTSFTYVLPFSPTQALVEFTLFTEELIADQQYDQHLKQYIDTFLPKSEYKILHSEQGVIPMSNYNFAQHNTKKITKIGTGGGWVKPSSGYSFSNSEKYADMVVKNLLASKPTTKGIYKKRFQQYDTWFLDVLRHNNKDGEQLFSSLYTKTKTSLILRFLDEETTFFEELKVMATFNPFPFLRAVIRQLFR